MVFNVTFNNFSVILWRSVLLVEEIGKNPRIYRKSLTNFITYCCIEYTSPSTGLIYRAMIQWLSFILLGVGSWHLFYKDKKLAWLKFSDDDALTSLLLFCSFWVWIPFLIYIWITRYETDDSLTCNIGLKNKKQRQVRRHLILNKWMVKGR
jgi:hypothetical protein